MNIKVPITETFYYFYHPQYNKEVLGIFHTREYDQEENKLYKTYYSLSFQDLTTRHHKIVDQNIRIECYTDHNGRFHYLNEVNKELYDFSFDHEEYDEYIGEEVVYLKYKNEGIDFEHHE